MTVEDVENEVAQWVRKSLKRIGHELRGQGPCSDSFQYHKYPRLKPIKFKQRHLDAIFHVLNSTAATSTSASMMINDSNSSSDVWMDTLSKCVTAIIDKEILPFLHRHTIEIKRRILEYGASQLTLSLVDIIGEYSHAINLNELVAVSDMYVNLCKEICKLFLSAEVNGKRVVRMTQIEQLIIQLQLLYVNKVLSSLAWYTVLEMYRLYIHKGKPEVRDFYDDYFASDHIIRRVLTLYTLSFIGVIFRNEDKQQVDRLRDTLLTYILQFHTTNEPATASASVYITSVYNFLSTEYEYLSSASTSTQQPAPAPEPMMRAQARMRESRRQEQLRLEQRRRDRQMMNDRFTAMIFVA
jgi:hypothetical protein